MQDQGALGANAPNEPPPLYDERGLPQGWSTGFHAQSSRYYYQDDLATPPRVIWVHPLDDPEFIRKRHRQDHHNDNAPRYETLESDPLSPRRSSSSPPPPSSSGSPGSPSPDISKGSSSGKSARVILGSLKDKLIGTREEREKAFQERQTRAREEERLSDERWKAALARREKQRGEPRHTNRVGFNPLALDGGLSGGLQIGNPLIFRSSAREGSSRH